jgi:hypothetical protein
LFGRRIVGGDRRRTLRRRLRRGPGLFGAAAEEESVEDDRGGAVVAPPRDLQGFDGLREVERTSFFGRSREKRDDDLVPTGLERAIVDRRFVLRPTRTRVVEANAEVDFAISFEERDADQRRGAVRRDRLERGAVEAGRGVGRNFERRLAVLHAVGRDEAFGAPFGFDALPGIPVDDGDERVGLPERGGEEKQRGRRYARHGGG